MRIPQSQNLHSQSFLSDKLEFVWVFPDPKGGIRQFILGVTKNEGCYMEVGNIDLVGNYVDEPNWASNVNPPQFYESDIWSQMKPPFVYNNLILVEDLIDLVTDCKVYFK
jgi:hypothetical protein